MKLKLKNTFANDPANMAAQEMFGLTERRGSFLFWTAAFGVAIVGYILPLWISNEYVYFALFVVLQYVVIATGWNVLGGYVGYVNFGTAAFFAIGAYTAVFLSLAFQSSMFVAIIASAFISGLVGLVLGYLTLRLRGVYFSIATLAMAIVMQTFVTNWDYVGGAAGVVILPEKVLPPFSNYQHYLFFVMLLIAIVVVGGARAIERSTFGKGLAAIRDDELASECCGVPTLRLKLVATTISGAIIGLAGAPLPYYTTYIDPLSAFSLSYSVNALAMPLIGGTATWLGPVVGAVLLASIQQFATVTISSSVNLLIAGVLLIVFVIAAPKGIVGIFSARRERSK